MTIGINTNGVIRRKRRVCFVRSLCVHLRHYPEIIAAGGFQALVPKDFLDETNRAAIPEKICRSRVSTMSLKT